MSIVDVGEYPKGFITRRVNNSGDMSWHKQRVFISEVFHFEELGFEQVQEDFYKVFFRDVEIGEFDLRRFQDVYFTQWPECREHLKWPGIAYFVVHPHWLRYSDYDQTPPLIQELDKEILVSDF